ncbi:MAG: nicotinamide-nucleotide amidase [Pseudomonadota bacterium]|nr:nicotinamide-nucleotide amidase [Pseudomonadota bacterium]
MDPPSEPLVEDLLPRLAAHLLASGRRLVTAESCTGGWIAKVCTDLPGSSGWFLGGAVVYDNALKATVLGVNPQTLAEAGAVSEAVVREMAAGALARLGGDLAVAVSGVAGPDGGTPDKPVGTVWFAWGRRGAQGTMVRTALERFPGDRDAVRRQAVECALRGVLEP